MMMEDLYTKMTWSGREDDDGIDASDVDGHVCGPFESSTPKAKVCRFF